LLACQVNQGAQPGSSDGKRQPFHDYPENDLHGYLPVDYYSTAILYHFLHKTLSLPSNNYHHGTHPKILKQYAFLVGAASHPPVRQVTAHPVYEVLLEIVGRYISDDLFSDGC
jgi:hypothetical protein